MKANDIFQAQQVLAVIERQPARSISQALAVMRAITPARAELEMAAKLIQEQHKALLEQYAAKGEKGELKLSEDGTRYTFEDGQQEVFEAAFAELMDQDVEIVARVDATTLEEMTAESSGAEALTPLGLRVLLPLLA